MARDVNRLNGKKVPGMREPGLFADGAGLYLRIDQTGSRRWVYIFYRAGRRREMGLGSIEIVKLTDARAAAEKVDDTFGTKLDTQSPLTDRDTSAQLAPSLCSVRVSFGWARKATSPFRRMLPVSSTMGEFTNRRVMVRPVQTPGFATLPMGSDPVTI